jgi:glycosyltransferase involved in cell wall biosynthesis
LSSESGASLRVHHHIQDGGSSDGTVEFLKEYVAKQPSTDNYQLTFASEADNGMYDAINKGWDRADDSVDWLGHLNSDEQYQPGTLARIAQSGVTHPSWGAITGNCVWVDEEGNYLCSRKPSIGWPWVGRIWIPAFTCALFIRRKFYGSEGVRFDTSWKSLGDKAFCHDLLNAGCKFGYQDDYMALFTHRGDANLGFQPITEVERRRYWEETLTCSERRFALLSIFAARVSRVLRSRLGARCKSYTWIDLEGRSREVEVNNHRWNV